MTIHDQAVRLEVTPLSPTIGAEIRGVDLRDLDGETVAAIRAAWLEHKVVFFPGQHLTADEHVRFAAWFGETTEGHPVIPGMKANPEIFEIDYTLARKVATKPGKEPPPQNGIDWHTDVTYMEEPPMGSILRAVTIPAAGGDTMFSDQQAAYEALSPAMQAFLGTLTAMHDGRPSFQGLLDRVGEGKWNGEKVVALEPIGTSGHPDTPGDRQQDDLRQRRVHHPHRRSRTGRKRRATAIPLQARVAAEVHRALPLARRRRRLLGQPVDAAFRGGRLRRGASGHPTHHSPRRQACLTRLTTFGLLGDDERHQVVGRALVPAARVQRVIGDGPRVDLGVRETVGPQPPARLVGEQMGALDLLDREFGSHQPLGLRTFGRDVIPTAHAVNVALTRPLVFREVGDNPS